jgi:hypothetical protein
MSSVHSRSSHGACQLSPGAGVGGPQSKYIAQHLRRASILEDRKARLADRAAHAEKVRLRAALAKSATKDTSASEERALAAAQARERNLAEIAAACAEEVKRAKAVAEAMKERREQEIRKMRTQMEERLAEAERRREELKTRNAVRFRGRERGQSLVTNKPVLVEVLPQVKEVKEREPSPMSRDAAVSKIQSHWRTTMRRRTVNQFADLGLTVEGVRETSFETVTELLARDDVLQVTGQILRICGLREGDSGSINEMAAVRTFLSAFLILGHPAQVLSTKDGKGQKDQMGPSTPLAKPIPRDDLANPQLQDLVGKARDLLISFENVLSRLTSFNNYTPPPALLGSLSEVYATYHNAFIAWKARDSNSLVEVMVMQFVELDAIWQSVKDNTDGSVDEVYRQSIQDNQVMLMVRIKKLAGPVQGKKLVFDAVRKARKARAKKAAGDTKPRIADQSITPENSMRELSDAASASEPAVQGQTPTPPSTPQRRSQTPHIVVHAGKFQGLLPDNRVVAHELAIDREFRIDADEYKQQQEHLLQPVFRQMRVTMESGDKERHFLLLLEAARYIRIKLQRLVKPGNSMHTFIAEMLDTDVAYQQFNTGSFSYERFFQSMGSLLPKLCAPVRDEEVQDLITNKLSQGNHVDRLEALMGFIDVMLSDYANYLLQLGAPRIIESAAQYEAKVFQTAMEKGEHGLEAAEAAWCESRRKVYAEAARRDPEGINHARSRPTPDRIYAQMLVDIFTRLSPIPEEEMPEMLRLDYRRALRCGQVTRRIITAGAILLQCKNLLKRDVRAPWRVEASRILTVLEAAETPRQSASGSTQTNSANIAVDGIMAALETGRSMPAATKLQLRALVSRIVTASMDTLSGSATDPREPVLSLLLTRLRGHILARVAAASASEKVKVTSTAGEKLAGLGMVEFVDRVRDMVDEISKVGSVDRAAHGPWWETVAESIDKAIRQNEAAKASSSTT